MAQKKRRTMRNIILWAVGGMLAWAASPEAIGLVPIGTAAVIRADGVVDILTPDGSVAASLVVEIAETPEARARGLMGRVLGDFMAGMLFVFETPQPQTFWMRNTPGALDMLFIDDKGRVLNVASHTTPMSDQMYSSAGPAQFVLETKAGFADRFGIRPGWSIRWKRR